MHELSIALRVVETLTEELSGEAGDVLSVRLRMGVLSGVVPDALRFAWDVACRDTRLQGSQLHVEEVGVSIWCEACERELLLPDVIPLRCPLCAAPASRVLSGRELEILSVEMIERHEQAEAD